MLEEPFWFLMLVGWFVDSGSSLPTLAWLSLSYATQHMRQSIFEFLGQVLTAILAWF
jgi:hypothetical protein